MKKDKKDWSEEFDNEFGKVYLLYYDNYLDETKKMKDFIRSLLKSEREDLIKKVERQLKKELADARHSIPKGEYKDGYLMGYSDAKETIIDVLELLEE